jgi:hypothetical protein
MAFPIWCLWRASLIRMQLADLEQQIVRRQIAAEAQRRRLGLWGGSPDRSC